MDALLSPAGIDQLRQALTGAGYTPAGIAARIGPQASAAAARGDVRAALRTTTGGDPLATLIRVLVCGQVEPEAAVADALAPLPLADALAAGLVDRAAAWLDWFDARKIEAVGFGLMTLRRSGHDDPVVRVEDLRQRVEPPFGEQIAAWFDRQDWLRGADRAGMLDARYRAADGLQLRQEATLGEDGWAVDRQVLAMPHGLRWVDEVDPLVLALVGGGTGEVRLRDQLTLLAAAHEVAADDEACRNRPQPALSADLAEAAVPVVAHLVERGMLVPCEP